MLKSELKDCENATKAVEEQLGGKRKAKDVLSFIDRVRKGDVVLDGNTDVTSFRVINNFIGMLIFTTMIPPAAVDINQHRPGLRRCVFRITNLHLQGTVPAHANLNIMKVLQIGWYDWRLKIVIRVV